MKPENFERAKQIEATKKELNSQLKKTQETIKYHEEVIADDKKPDKNIAINAKYDWNGTGSYKCQLKWSLTSFYLTKNESKGILSRWIKSSTNYNSN